MFNKLKLDNRFIYYDVMGQGVAFVSESGIKTLVGNFWLPLVKQLTGAFSFEEIQTKLKGQISPSKLRMMLSVMQRQGILVDAGTHDKDVPPHDKPADDRASQIPIQVALFGIGASDLNLARQVLTLGGVACSDDASVAVVITDHYLRPELKGLNRDRLRSQKPWLLVKIDGKRPWLGALFVPGQGPCWDCFAARWSDRDQTLRYLSHIANGDRIIVPPLQAAPATRLAALAFVPAIVERFVRTGNAGSMISSIWTLDLDEGNWQRHTIVKRPQCPTCGDPLVAIPKPTNILHQREGSVTIGDTHHSPDPLQTWERLEHHISPITGVVDTFSLESMDEFIYCYKSMRNDIGPLRKPIDLLSPRAHVYWGKGVDLLQARLSALAEALERYSLTAERPPDFSRATFVELGTAAVDPRALLLFSDAQYADSKASHPDVPSFERVPHMRFDPEQVIGWTAGWSLTEQRARLIPSDYCWMTPASTRDADFCVSDTNGCAAGYNLEDAILRGLFELVERDSAAIWWYNMTRQPGVDLAGFEDPQITAIHRHYREKLRRELWVLDITSDIGIPVFAAISALPEESLPEFVFGFGCHQNPDIALRRAVTELNQLTVVLKSMLTVPANPNPWNNTSPGVLKQLEDWLRRTHRDQQPHLLPAENKPPRSRSDFQNTDTRDPRQNLLWCVERLRALGIHLIVVDVTRPDIGLSVARVIAPGLRHFWRRLAPGRLYDVPVALGWLDRPKAEHELNPVSIFI